MFNHPLLKYYHAEKATEKRAEKEIADHKKKMFQLYRWDYLKSIKKDLYEKKVKEHQTRAACKLFIKHRYVLAICRKIHTNISVWKVF